VAFAEMEILRGFRWNGNGQLRMCKIKERPFERNGYGVVKSVIGYFQRIENQLEDVKVIRRFQLCNSTKKNFA
jgi:hypothetical protein